MLKTATKGRSLGGGTICICVYIYIHICMHVRRHTCDNAYARGYRDIGMYGACGFFSCLLGSASSQFGGLDLKLSNVVTCRYLHMRSQSQVGL